MSLVIVSVLLSTQMISHRRRQQVPRRDRVQRRRHHDCEADAGDPLAHLVLRADAVGDARRAAARRRGCCRRARSRTSCVTHACMTPRVSTPCVHRRPDAADGADRVDRAQVMVVPARRRHASREPHAERRAEQRRLDVVRGERVAREQHVDPARRDQLLEVNAGAGVDDRGAADEEDLPAPRRACQPCRGPRPRRSAPSGAPPRLRST